MARAPEVTKELFGNTSSALDLTNSKLVRHEGGKSDSQLWSTFNESEVKLNILVSDHDIRTCSVTPEVDSVLDLKQKVGGRQMFAEEMAQDLRIRLIFQGKLMLDGCKVAAYSDV